MKIYGSHKMICLISYERSSNIFSALHLLHLNCTHLSQSHALVVVAGEPPSASIANPKRVNGRLVVVALAGVAPNVKTPTTNHHFGAKPMLQKFVGDPMNPFNCLLLEVQFPLACKVIYCGPLTCQFHQNKM